MNDTHSVDLPELVKQRSERLRRVLNAAGLQVLLTADPFGIRYATGCRNMLVHGLTGPDRMALVFADGPTVLWEFAGCEHLSSGAVAVDEVRAAPGLSAKKTPNFRQEAAAFAAEIADLVRRHGGQHRTVAVDRLDTPVTDALRATSLDTVDGTEAMQVAMSIKQPAEIDAMYAAMRMTERSAHALEAAVVPGQTEQQVWAEFHRELITGGGELVVTRLLQAGHRTFPYFQEASDHQLAAGDLVCFDTDAVASHGYSVDFSRTFLCGGAEPTSRQLELYSIASEQLTHNAANLAPGRSFESFARSAFDVPDPYRLYGYYQLAHGLGMAGGQPNIPRFEAEPYAMPGDFEPGMVICVESYVGDPETRQGVKLEDQFLITESGVDTMSVYPFDDRLGALAT